MESRDIFGSSNMLIAEGRKKVENLVLACREL